MRSLLMLGLLAAGAAHATSPQDYAWQWPVQAEGDDAAYVLELDAEVLQHVSRADLRDLDTLQIPVLVSLILSLELRQPVATKQSNLVEMLNTFFSNSEERHKFAGLIRRVAGATDQLAALQKPSVARKLRASLTSPQITQGSVEGRIVHALFPDILMRSAA